MADEIGATHDNGQPAYWIEEGTFKPYKYKMVNGVEDRSQKLYLSPQAIDPYSTDRGGQEGNGFIKGRAQWDTAKGEWKRPINWGNIMAAGVGGMIAAPAIAGALAGGAAGGTAAGAAAPLATTATGIPTIGGLATGATLASSTAPMLGTGLAGLSAAAPALAATTTAAPVASAVVPGAGMSSLAPATLASTTTAVPTTGALPTAGTGSLPGGGSNLVGTITRGKKFADILMDAEHNLAGQSQQMAQNREVEQRAASDGPRTDAMALRNMNHASYIADGGFKGTPATYQGKELPSYGFGPTASNPAAQSFAQQMQDELLRRMKNKQPLTLSGIAPAGKAEKATNMIGQGIGWAKTAKSIYDLF